MSNRRDFLKMLGLGAIAPIVPKIPVAPTATAVTPTFISGKIKTGGLIAKIEGSEVMRISSNGDIKLMERFNEAYEKALWAGNSQTNKNI